MTQYLREITVDRLSAVKACGTDIQLALEPPPQPRQQLQHSSLDTLSTK